MSGLPTGDTGTADVLASESASEVAIRVIPGSGKSAASGVDPAPSGRDSGTDAIASRPKLGGTSRTNVSFSTSYPKKPLGYRFVKRAFDIAFSSAVIAVGALPGALLSIAVVADTKGSPIYAQERIGRGGRPFRMYKFRTMVADSDDVEKHLSAEQLAQWRHERKVDDDPRITPLGRKLRRLSIDEFPQFINVWLGQISTIGPRVITAEEMEWFGEDKAKLLSVPPGITGLWQTGPRNKVNFEDGSRQALELSYVDGACLRLDAKLLIETIPAMISGTGK